MKIAITFEHTDLIKFIEEMLAMKGMKPAEPIVFQRKRNKRGSASTATSNGYEVMVMCEDAPPLETCPMCQHSLRAESPAPTPSPARVSTPSVSEPFADTEPVSLMAGESVDPPFGNTTASADSEGGDGGGMAAIIAQSRAIEASKKREQEARRFNKKPRTE